MEHNDREYEDVLNKELKGVEPSDELYAKVRDCIARGVVHTRHRKTALGTVAVLVVAIMALSSVTPVFGRNGTLPQVINAMAAERRVQKIAQTLGTATVQQTSAALLIPEATVQAVANSALSKSDGILALVIADCAGKSAGDVVALRIQGFGWGVIMAQLGISGRDISGAVGQAQAVASANTPPAPSQGNVPSGQPAVSNKAGDKVVANGEITVASPTSLTVAGTTFAIVTDTQMKYHGKAITPGDLVTKFLAGKLSATIQGTQLADTSLCANLVIVQDVPENEQHEQTQQQEQNSLIRTWQGTIIVVFPPAGSDLGSVLVGGQVGQPVLYRMTSTSVLQGTKENGGHYTLTMEALQALATTSPQAVTIQGTLLADGTVEIFKLTITTVNTTAASGPMNPGRGNGTDKPGKN